jgi:iron complex transport system permease protein
MTTTTAASVRPLRPRGLAPLWAVAAVILLVVSVGAGVAFDPAHIGFGDLLLSVAAKLHLRSANPLSPTDDTILWQLRMPRVVLGLLVGGMLGLAGATYQGVFRNPLADPYLLGVAAGAGLGATVAIVYLPRALGGHQLLPPAAFVGGAGAVGLSYLVGRSVGRERDAATLVLAGVTVASFLTAVQTFVQQQHADTLQEVYSWILGRLPSSGWDDVVLILPYVVVTTAVILVLRRTVDVFTLGDEEAASLGVDVGATRLVLVLAATVGTAAAVAVSGLIAFVGIIVPHAIRLATGANYRALLPLSFVVGGAFLVLADVIARTVLSPAELPIGIVTAFVGAPFFAVILRTARPGAG